MAPDADFIAVQSRCPSMAAQQLALVGKLALVGGRAIDRVDRVDLRAAGRGRAASGAATRA
jgi:hypothetical protein